jgi:hypothetical protein
MQRVIRYGVQRAYHQQRRMSVKASFPPVSALEMDANHIDFNRAKEIYNVSHLSTEIERVEERDSDGI